MRGDDKCCSFCGSLHPDRVLELIKKNGFEVVDPSDKSYKWYINQKNVPNAGYGGIKYYRQHDTDEFIKAYNELVDYHKGGKRVDSPQQVIGQTNEIRTACNCKRSNQTTMVFCDRNCQY